jgi:hypothetical protein
LAESWDGADRRRHPRIDTQGEVRARIHTIAAAPVINLSASGALLEVPCVLKPRSTYTLRLLFAPDRHLDLRVRVIRSYVHGFGRNEQGEQIIHYRAAMEFLAVPEGYLAALEQLAARRTENGVRAELKT